MIPVRAFLFLFYQLAKAGQDEFARSAISLIKHSAYSFIMVNNHPSGDPSPSEADMRLTRRILEAGRILQLQLLDHGVIGAPAPGRSSYFSFKEGGVIG